MKIGVMLRHVDQHGGGVSVYTENLLRELLRIDTPHEFVLMYRDRRFMGTYGNGGHVREVAMAAPDKLIWDQVAVPIMVRREEIDLIFNPKYSIPLAVRCPTVFVCHGLDWFVNPAWSRWQDRLSHRFLVPRYARKAKKIIAVSDTTREHVLKYLPVKEDNVETVYLGLGEHFWHRLSDERLKEVRNARGLPERFFLYCGQIYPPKNFGRLLRAYAQVGPELGVALVVAGEHTWLCGEELALIDELNLTKWVIRPGWISHDELPAFYQLAEALVMPSLYEACPSPPLEAMASDCPVVTANRYGTKEIAGNAAVLVDPENVDNIADGMKRVIVDAHLRRELIDAGRARAQRFTWVRCANATLGLLQSVLGNPY